MPDNMAQRSPVDYSSASAQHAVDTTALDQGESPEPHVPRVAVLAVHGIGQHAAGSSEDAMVDLLLALPPAEPDGPRPFGPFRAVDIQIPLQTLRVPEESAPKTSFGARLLNLYEEQSTELAREQSAKSGRSKAGLDAANVHQGETGYEFMSMLLRDYQGGAAGNFYTTKRLEGTRDTSAALGGRAEAHIYEVLWADLASANNTFLRFFLALFQLLLHLGSLSRLAVDTGSIENSGFLWQAYLSMQRYAVRMLQIFLPLFKVILLIALFSCVPGLPNGIARGIAVPILLCALAGTIIGLLVLTTIPKAITVSPWIWAAGAFVPGALGAGVGSFSAFRHGNAAGAGSIASWICLGVPLLYFVLSQYENVRKGVQVTGWVSYFAFLSFYVFCLRNHSVQQASFWTVEWVVAAIRASWLLMFAFAFLALVFSSLLLRREKKNSPERARLRAGIRTSRLALALPAILFLLITSMVWGSMFFFAKLAQKPRGRFFDDSLFTSAGWGTGLLSRLHLIPDVNCLVIPGDYLKSLLCWSLGYQLPITLALFALGLFLLTWWVIPGALTERFRLRNDQKPPRSSTNTQSVRLGSWISRGLDATSVVTLLVWCSIFLAPPVFYLLPEHFFPNCLLALLKGKTVSIVGSFFLLSSGAVLAAVVKYGSPVLGAVLDVDTYLRTTPQDATPRAKIVERYVSTLRYLAHYRGTDGHGYDSVVIVSHSLGTLITADLLRFLKHRGDPDLAAFGLADGTDTPEIPIKLLTMGSPIRQLLNRFFPYLYDWVRREPDNGLHPLPAPIMQPPALPPNGPPDPQELGVAVWVNTYRSGDYVGRSLWLDEWYCRTDPAINNGRYPYPIYAVSDGWRTEMCIGAGAHTHYWDDTAPDVAEVLNSLI
jgi:hypothetical protein